MSKAAVPSDGLESSGAYVVVARRYRPKLFEDLVGQQHVSQALKNAIATNRVGHAYLFTGARGVGKTSTARIFAKALNAPGGPTPTPDDDSDICQAIDAGEDVDVLEIDGASNRGIDEIRQLRSNANVRPSRCRYKIYIIDEVHMLTAAAFNALLKTLEEPPEHVKFIFCTTDPQKIPITVLSRCQRFDFAPVATRSIVERLELIVQAEGRQAEAEALELLARRASGSMRDSQSLLEQVLAFSSGTVRAVDVHQMLGTAESSRLSSTVEYLIARDAGQSLQSLDAAVAEGVDCGQLGEQLLGYLRDLMAIAVDCPADLLQQAAPSDLNALKAAADAMGLATILAAAQILDQALVRMRQSTDPRILLEIALVQICNLDDLRSLPDLVEAVTTGGTMSAQVPVRSSAAAAPPAGKPRKPAEGVQKKTTEITDGPNSGGGQATDTAALTPDNVAKIWQQVIDETEDMTSVYASYFHSIAISAPNRVAVSFLKRYTLQKQSCEQPERKSQLEQAISRRVGQSIQIDFHVVADVEQAVKRPVKTRRQMMREKEDDPLVRQAIELFGAEVTRVDMPRGDAQGG